MTAESKAKELISKFNNSYDEESESYILYQNVEESKRCALIAVEFAREFITGDLSESFDKTMYLFEVKQEIESL
jgi:hypothetical protein